MEVKREQGQEPCLAEEKMGVSILVLMEVKRELDSKPKGNQWDCFNPCFDGSEARGWPRP